MLRFLIASAIILVVAAPAPVHSQVSTADAAAFVGDWHLPLDAMGQPINLHLAITDADGVLDVRINRDTGHTDVEEIELRDATLILEYEVDVQGQMAPVELRLTPDGEGLRAAMDIADGMLDLDGTATRH